MRKLYLVNEVGTTYFLDYKGKTLVEAIEGLGFEFEIEYQDFGDAFVESKRKVPQKTIRLSLVFLEGYVGYSKWRDFTTKSKEIRLFYIADGTKYCYVNVRSSSKTQLEAGILRSEVELECLSLWLVDKYAAIYVNQSNEGKTYPYKYTYIYAVSFNGKTTITNECSRPVPLTIKISGNVLNPRVLISQNGKVITSLRLLLDEREEPVLEICANPKKQYMRKTENGDQSDIYEDQDFSHDNFLFLPPGTSEVFFDPGVREVSSCQITYQEEYVAH